MKKIVSLMLTLLVLCGTFTITAFADNETEQETTVSYTVESHYTVDIPAYINLNENSGIDITAYPFIGSGKSLIVSIDTGRSLENGFLYLCKDGDPERGRLAAQISVYDAADPSQPAPLGDDGIVAVFEHGNGVPVRYGHVDFSVGIPTDAAFGSYIGVIYFCFSVE